MIYSLNLLYSIICSYSFSTYYNIGVKNKSTLYLLFLAPMWTIWLFICGGQYYVGTDYKAYYNIFKNQDLDLYYNNNEYLFVFITKLSGELNLHPQIPFYIFYFIGFVFLFLLISKLHHKTSFIFIILYITVSTVFNNQLNGLRQYIAIYICSFGVLLLKEKYGIIKFISSVIIASMMHTSALFFIPFTLFVNKIRINYKTIKLILLTSIVFAIWGKFDFIIGLFDFMIPIQYQHYITSTFNTTNNFNKILTKLIFIPFYWESIKLLKNNLLHNKDLFFYKIGILAYSTRLFFLNNYIFTRIGDLLILISIFPLYYLLREFYLNKKNTLFILTILFFISFYLVKVILLPKQEYLYNSIYFL